MLPGILASMAYLGMPLAQVMVIMINMTNIMIIMISVVMILTKVSFAGASLVTSFFLARRGKAFLEPGQDLEAAVNRYMNEYSMIFMIFTPMTNCDAMVI